MKKFIFLFILLIFFYLYLHYYIASFFSKAGINKTFAIISVYLICTISLLTLFIRHRLNNNFFEILSTAGYIWMGYVIILSFFILIANITLKIHPFPFKNVFWITFITSIVILIKSFYNAVTVPDFTKLSFESKYVDKNYKLIFISDIHLDSTYKNKLFSRVIDKIANENPDALIIGGDFVDPGFVLDKNIKKLKDLRFPVFFVLGNHEYYYGAVRTESIVKDLNFDLLKDRSDLLGRINIIGISDIRTEELDKSKVIEFIGKNYKKDYFNIFVSHQPLYFKEISDKYELLMLSGHTHCGQIFPFHLLTRLGYKYFCGEYANKNSLLYVSSGEGTWGPQLRFLAKPEIVLINIKSTN
ncbi:MAG: metallophosphoesterase [Elusimicrobiales bacterium]|nr:metallophosphoesterase [Elusimicrobiales bacterium]